MTDNIQNHFTKQRRNLILISLLVIFYKSANISIDEINILGNKASVGNPAVLSFCIIIFFIYYFWRYLAACISVEGIKRYLDVYKTLELEVALKKAYKIVKKNTKLIPEKDFTLSYDFSQRRKNTAENISSHCFKPSTSNSNSISEQSVKSNFIEHSNLQITGIDYYKIKIIAFAVTVTRDTPFGEYVFPYLLAFTAIVEILGFSLVLMILDSFEVLYSTFNDWITSFRS